MGDTLFTDRNWSIVDAIRRVAAAVEASPAQVALAWVVGRPAVASTLMGVSKVAQVADNIAALDLVLAPDQLAALDAASATASAMIYGVSIPAVRQSVVFGGDAVAAWREARA